ncbi:MAG: hypothetical protein ACREOY_02185 [Candidatus Dormibacteraceae bacterium]
MAAVTAFACSPQPGSSALASPSPSVSAIVLTSGCGSTPIFKGGAPGWAHQLEGTSTYQEFVPYVLAAPATVIGFLYGYPLRAGHPENPSNKILWLVNLPPRAGSLDISAHPVGAPAPIVNQSAAFLTSGDVPSIIDLPQSGCWHFDLTWSGHHAGMDIAYQ